MNFTESEIAAIVGIKELELIALRKEVMRLSEEVKRLTKTVEKPMEDAQ